MIAYPVQNRLLREKPLFNPALDKRIARMKLLVIW